MRFNTLVLLSIFTWGVFAFGAQPTVTNCGNQPACNDFSVTATGGTLFQHHDTGHDGNGNLTSINNEAISTSSATGFTTPAVVNSGTFRNKTYCATTAVCPAGTNIGQLQVGTGLPVANNPFQSPQFMLYTPDVFSFTDNTNQGLICPGASPLLLPQSAPCGSYIIVGTNGACAKFGPNSQGDTVPKCTGTTPMAGGLSTNDGCSLDGSVPCAFIGRFKTGLPIVWATDFNGNSFLAGAVVGLIPYPGKSGNFYQVSCTLVVTTTNDDAAWINGHEAIQTVTINSCQ